MQSYDVNEKIPFSLASKSIFQKTTAISEITNALKRSMVKKDYKLYYFNYGRNALNYLFNELNLKNKKILFPAFVCPSLAYSAISAGAKPVFADVSLDDFNITSDSLKKQGLSEVSAVCAVHTFGFPFDAAKILELKKKYGFYFIEDAAHAFFAKNNSEYVGNSGDSVLFSMYKQLPNLSGAILSSKKEYNAPNQKQEGNDIAALLRFSSGIHQPLLNLLRSSKNLPEDSLDFSKEFALPSESSLYLFSTLFSGLEYSVKRKSVLAKQYYTRLKNSDYFLPQKIREGAEPSWFNFSIRLKPGLAGARDKLLLELRKKGIFCDRQWYLPPIFLKEFGAKEEDYPNASLLAKTIINLPIHPDYSEENVNYLFDSIEKTTGELV